MSSKLDVSQYIQAIIKDAEEKAQAIIKDAEEKAQAIIKDAEEKAQAIAKQEALEYVTALKSRIVDKKVREFASERTLLKSRILNQLYGIILDKFKSNVNENIDRYYQLLYGIIKSAVMELNSSKLIVSGNARDLNYLRANLDSIKSRLRDDLEIDVDFVIGEKLDIIGGFIFRTPDNTRTYIATIEGLIKKAIERNATRIVKRLGLFSKKRFIYLIEKMLHVVGTKKSIEIRDAFGKSITLPGCKKILHVMFDDNILLVCEDSSIAFYATLSMLDADKLNRFMSGIEKVQEEYKIDLKTKFIIAFSGYEGDIRDSLNKKEIFLLTKQELFDLDRKINAGIFI